MRGAELTAWHPFSVATRPYVLLDSVSSLPEAKCPCYEKWETPMIERKQTAILIEVTQIENVDALKFILDQTHDYFSEPQCNQPPIPGNVWSFVPCKLLITELEPNDLELLHRTRIGRIQFMKLDNTSLYDKEWIIDAGQFR
jgi:hypothetical protein